MLKTGIKVYSLLIVIFLKYAFIYNFFCFGLVCVPYDGQATCIRYIPASCPMTSGWLIEHGWMDFSCLKVISDTLIHLNHAGCN